MFRVLIGFVMGGLSGTITMFLLMKNQEDQK